MPSEPVAVPTVQDAVRIAQSGVEPGCSEARLSLLATYRPLLSSITRRASTEWHRRHDVEQAAVLGFLEALRRFDPERGVPLGAFARPYVRRHVFSAAYPKAEGLPSVVSIDHLTLDHEPESQDQSLGRIDQSDMVDGVRAFVAGLPPRHRRLLWSVFVDGQTQTAVAAERGVTRAAVNQMLAGIYRRGREELRTFAPSHVAA